MDPEYAGKSSTGAPYWIDLDQMADTPTRRGRHRRAQSETFFHFPDLDDILLDDVVADLSLDPQNENEPSSFLPPPLPHQSGGNGSRPPPAHLRSLSMDADFFEGFSLDGGAPTQPISASGPRHRHSSSMDEYSSATSADGDAKKAIPADRLAELAMIDPKRAKRILANRQSAARSKERKTRYASELEKKVQTLQSEATTLSAQITLLQRDTTGLTTKNKELKLKLQAMEQQAHLRDALNEALRNEVQWLKIAAGQPPPPNGNNGATLRCISNHHGQHQLHHIPRSGSSNSAPSGQPQQSFEDFNQRA